MPMDATPFEKIIALLDANHADYRVVEHAPEGRSVEVSAIRGNKLEEACKALVVRAKRTKKAAERQYFLLCFPSDRQTDFDLLEPYKDVRLCDLSELERLTSCVPGTVPPFSFNPELELLMDPRVLENEKFWFNAGRLDRSIQLSSADYLRIVRPTLRQLVR